MARNTQVAADHNAPPVTPHPGAVRRRPPQPRLERRGGPRSPPHLHQLGGLRRRRRAPRDRRKPRWARCRRCSRRRRPRCSAARERVDMASAALINGISSHTFDFDDTHLKTIIHPAGPVASARAGAGRAHRRQRPRADRRAGAGHRRRLPRRQRDVPRPLRPRLAHHRQHRHARRGRGLRAPARPGRAQDRDGAGHRRVAADRHARAVRHHDQALPSRRRGARRPDGGADGAARLHRQPARARSAARHERRPSRPRTTGTRSPTNSASASRSASTPTSPSPAAS